jgi:hypothetical protein
MGGQWAGYTRKQEIRKRHKRQRYNGNSEHDTQQSIAQLDQMRNKRLFAIVG